MLIYAPFDLDQIKQGRTIVGNLESSKPADIKLSGANILPEHCYFECITNEDGTDVVTLHAGSGSTTMVNGLRIPPGKVSLFSRFSVVSAGGSHLTDSNVESQPKELKSGFRIILGDFHVFRFK